MTSARNNPQKASRQKVIRFDEELQFVVEHLFNCTANVTTALKWACVSNIRDLHRVLGKADIRNKIRFKQEGDDNGGEELFDDQEYEELMRGFDAFLALPPESREGSDPITGLVKYDPVLALKFEEINKVGQFAPPLSTNATTQSTSNAGSSSTANNKHTLTDDERKLTSFYKKFKPQDSTFPVWSTLFLSKLKLLYEENILDPTYVVPTLANGDSQAAVDLHEKQNTHLYTLLSESVTTLVGSRLIMDHVDDGITVWEKLLAHYGDNVAAEERASQIFQILITGSMDPDRLSCSESALTSIFREGNEGKSTMVELIIGKYKE
eukprot:scaffold2711_cov87-Skeletonema_dohrnii-CCMP3373.AAC.2